MNSIIYINPPVQNVIIGDHSRLVNVRRAADRMIVDGIIIFASTAVGNSFCMLRLKNLATMHNMAKILPKWHKTDMIAMLYAGRLIFTAAYSNVTSIIADIR